MTGIMNAISSGLLIFASLVELMAEDFLSDDSWEVSHLPVFSLNREIGMLICLESQREKESWRLFCCLFRCSWYEYCWCLGLEIIHF